MFICCLNLFSCWLPFPVQQYDGILASPVYFDSNSEGMSYHPSLRRLCSPRWAHRPMLSREKSAFSEHTHQPLPNGDSRFAECCRVKGVPTKFLLHPSRNLSSDRVSCSLSSTPTPYINVPMSRIVQRIQLFASSTATIEQPIS